jgi:hypothetical protein
MQSAQCIPALVHYCIWHFVKRITSRQNALVSRFRAVGQGDDRSVVLLDGLHLVADALDAGLLMHQAVATAEGLGHTEIAELVARIEAAGTEIIVASSPVMAALSPVRSSAPSWQSPIGPRSTTRGPPRNRHRCSSLPATFRIRQRRAIMCASRKPAAPPGRGGRHVRRSLWLEGLRGSMGSAFRLPIAIRAHVDQAVAHAGNAAAGSWRPCLAAAVRSSTWT